MRLRSERLKTAGMLAAAALASVALLEGATWTLRPPAPPDRQVTPFYYEPDPVLGWRLKPGIVSRDVERIDGRTLYDVTYTIDRDGRRVAPPDRGDARDGCVFFFGCSFTFGQGVDDTQTLAYRTGVLTQGRWRVVNYATSGYSVEHMLAMLERGDLQRRTPCRPTRAVYQAIVSHVGRAAGLYDFSERGPRYALQAGQLRYVGTRQMSEDGWRPWLHWQLSKSYLANLVRSSWQRPSEADLPLYLAIVGRSRDMLASAYPGVEFHVLLWEEPEDLRGDLAVMRRGLAAITPHVHRVAEILPPPNERPHYRLHPRDRHPTAEAHDRLAGYVATRVLTARP